MTATQTQYIHNVALSAGGLILLGKHMALSLGIQMSYQSGFFFTLKVRKVRVKVRVFGVQKSVSAKCLFPWSLAKGVYTMLITARQISLYITVHQSSSAVTFSSHSLVVMNFYQGLVLASQTKRMWKVHVLRELNNEATACIANSVVQDTTHPLSHHLTLLPFGHRFRPLRCRKAHFEKSQTPPAMTALNNRLSWKRLNVYWAYILSLSLYVIIEYGVWKWIPFVGQ